MEIEYHNRKPQDDIPVEVITHYVVKDYRRMFLSYDELLKRAEKAEATIFYMKNNQAKLLSKHEKEIEQLKQDLEAQSKEKIKELKGKLYAAQEQNRILAQAIISQNRNENGKNLFQGMVPADAKELEEKIGFQLDDTQKKLTAAEEILALFKEQIENNDIPNVNEYTVNKFLTRSTGIFRKIECATQRIENFYKLVNGIPML